MRKPWEAPDLRHLKRLRDSKAEKKARESEARALAEALVPEDFGPRIVFDPARWLIMNSGGIIKWTPTRLKAQAPEWTKWLT